MDDFGLELLLSLLIVILFLLIVLPFGDFDVLDADADVEIVRFQADAQNKVTVIYLDDVGLERTYTLHRSRIVGLTDVNQVPVAATFKRVRPKSWQAPRTELHLTPERGTADEEDRNRDLPKVSD